MSDKRSPASQAENQTLIRLQLAVYVFTVDLHCLFDFPLSSKARKSYNGTNRSWSPMTALLFTQARRGRRPCCQLWSSTTRPVQSSPNGSPGRSRNPSLVSFITSLNPTNQATTFGTSAPCVPSEIPKMEGHISNGLDVQRELDPKIIPSTRTCGSGSRISSDWRPHCHRNCWLERRDSSTVVPEAADDLHLGSRLSVAPRPGTTISVH